LDSKIQRSLSPKFGLGESLGENDFTFSLIFGLSPNLGLTERLSERKSEMAQCKEMTSAKQTSNWDSFFVVWFVCQQNYSETYG